MRIDKYLKVSRIIKRRTIAKQLADEERIHINGVVAKPSSDVGSGDVIDIYFEHRHIQVKVTFIAEKMSPKHPPMFDLIKDERI